ncbi:hypothetical protein ACKI2N_030165 [Cupriavidus sp. 30B13]|uniref:hypothetical protein n=1 Tax=Cupriavidus sp. 30B13 TaxID=3384241 RepID=UPI003B8FB400
MGKPQRDALPFASLVDLVYDAALDDAAWQGMAAAIAQAFSSTSTVIKTYGDGGAVALESVTDNLRVSGGDQSWADHWHRHDLWVERSSQLALGEVFTSDSLMPEAEFQRSGFYQDWTRRLGIHHMVGVLFPIGDGLTGVLGVHREQRAGRYHDADRHQLQNFVPHVRRALAIRARLRAEGVTRIAALEALERIDTGVIVVTETCTLLYANRAAQALFGMPGGVSVRGRRLQVADEALNAKLLRQVRAAARSRHPAQAVPEPSVVLWRAGRLPLTLLVAPWRADRPGGDAGQPAATIFVRDPEAMHDATAARLRELFGLTGAEAVVALAIGNGLSPEQIAARNGVGIGTIRTHLRGVFLKTGTTRQAAVAALVAGIVPSAG